jgi:PiT family inorganic phosphate transporter
VLTRLGLPTSLTLGVVGGIVGAGLGRGLPIVAAGVTRVVLIGLAAPVVGALLARLLARMSSAVQAAAGGRGLPVLGWIALSAQAVAYAANDGQKMLAVLTVTAAGLTAPSIVGIAMLFALGSVVGTTSAAGTLGRGIASGAPYEEVAAQLGGSVAVLTSAALGVPVSMTQAVSGGLVGTGLLRGLRQIRWRTAGQLVVAWLLTLPTAVLAGVVIVRVWAVVT